MACIDFENFLQNLEKLISSNPDFVEDEEKEQLQSLHDELRFLGNFLRDSERIRDAHPEVKKLVMQIKDVAFRAENVVDLFVAKAFKKKKSMLAYPFCPTKKMLAANKSDRFIMFGGVRAVKEEIGAITSELKEIYEKNMFGIGVHNKDDANYSGGGASGSRQSVPQSEGETFVGLDDEATRIIEQLDEGRRKLKIGSIVGAAGAGKTTLARKVYHQGRIKEIFQVRGWITVSQNYSKRGLLIGILESSRLLEDGDKDKNDDQLGEQLLRHLKEKRYLIILDDIWSIEAWKDIERSFPNDNNGSNVIITTREANVAEGTQRLHDLRPLSTDQSWKLFQNKVFGKQRCPVELENLGKQIAEQCGGLPLAIVAIGGILANEDKTPERWEKVAESLSSVIARNDEVVMDTLALSYDHLPVHLKACFIYFGAFPEDYEIRVSKLILLWIAERFVLQRGEKSLEALAEDYVMDLVDRNLIMPATKRVNGKIKSCRIHDVLRELCLRKAVEDNFLVSIGKVSHFSSSSSSKYRRLCIENPILLQSITSFAPNVRSILSNEQHDYSRERPFFEKLSWFRRGLNLLTVLDLLFIRTLCFPTEILHLIHLRYLALRLVIPPSITKLTKLQFVIPPSITKLQNLETLIVRTDKDYLVTLPRDMLNMVKLRHLYLGKPGLFHFEKEVMSLYEEKWGTCPSRSENLQTMLYLCPCNDCRFFLAERAPNLIRKLGFYYGTDRGLKHTAFPNLECFKHLETLKYRCWSWNSLDCPHRLVEFNFPTTVKDITLVGTRVQWGELSILASSSLPNLEVLKLLDGACVGPVWEMADEESEDEESEDVVFCKLKYLKFECLDIEKWNMSSDAHFPSLQKLVIYDCQQLEEIPIDFAEMTALERIEVKYCQSSVDESAKKIKEERYDKGGDDTLLRVLITTYWPCVTTVEL